MRGASDAGGYVGQSENITVRRNYVYESVNGIEYAWCSTDPQDLAGVISAAFFSGEALNIFYGSSDIGTDSGLLLTEFPDGLTKSEAICMVDNGPQDSFGRLNGSVSLYPLSHYANKYRFVYVPDGLAAEQP